MRIVRRGPWPIISLCVAVAMGATHAYGVEPAPPPETAAGDATVTAPPPGKKERPLSKWHAGVGFTNAYPKLDSEKVVNRYLNPGLHLLAPGLDDLATIGELRDNHLLWVPLIGIGYDATDRVTLLLTLNNAAGKVRTKDSAPSILLLPLHVDFEIKRSAVSVGAGIDYYPWKRPHMDDYKGFMERIRAARPFLGLRFTWNEMGFRVKNKIGLKPLPVNLLSIEISDGWSLPSYSAVAGLDIPVTRRSLLNVAWSETYFPDRDYDFGGPALTIVWKRHF